MSELAYQPLRKYFDCQQANIVKGRIEAEGIPVFLLYEHHGTLAWGYISALGGVELVVPKNYYSAADQILQKIEDGDYLTLMRDISCYDNSYSTEEHYEDLAAPTCPKCSSSKQYYLSEGRSALFLSLLFCTAFTEIIYAGYSLLKYLLSISRFRYYSFSDNYQLSNLLLDGILILAGVTAIYIFSKCFYKNTMCLDCGKTWYNIFEREYAASIISLAMVYLFGWIIYWYFLYNFESLLITIVSLTEYLLYLID